MSSQPVPGAPSPDAPAAPRRGIFYGWYIVAASFTTNGVITAAYFQGFQAFVLPILDTFGWSRTQLAGASSLRQAESGIVGPLVGWFSDKYSPRWLILIGGIITGLGVIGLSRANNLLTYYVFFLLISVGTAGAAHGVTWPIIISRWFRKRRGRAMGIAMSGPVLGGLMVAPNTIMVRWWGWRDVLFAYGILILVVVVLMAWVARNRPEPYGYRVDGDAAPPPTPAGAGARARPAHLSAQETGLALGALKTRAFWIFALYLGGLGVVTSAFGLWQVPYFVDNGMSREAAAVTAVMAVLASGVGRVGGGVLMDYVDYRAMLLVVGLMMAGSQFYLLFVHADTILLATPFAVPMGAAMGTVIAMRPVVAGALFGTRYLGTVIGLLQGITIAEGLIGPLLMGRVYDATASYDIAIWIMGSVCVVVLVLLVFMRPVRRTT